MKKFVSLVIAASALSLAAPVAAQSFDGMATAVRVQADVNKRIKYVDDSTGHGRAIYRDSWVIPTRTGDCEDFALLKRQELIAAGFAPDDVQIIIVQRSTGDEIQKSTSKVLYLHVVVYIPSLNLILDNPAAPLEQVGYSSSKVPVKDYGVWMTDNSASLVCVVKDFTLGEGITLRQRCGGAYRIARKD